MLDIKDLSVHFATDAGVVRAVDDVSLSIGRGEVVAVVGGSGSGKTVLALSVLRLVSEPGKITGGEIIYGGRDLLKLPEGEMRKIRGKNISMIFQEPMTALNPVFTVGRQVGEAIEAHGGKAGGRVAELLDLVGIPDPSRKMKCYPHELSGGQRQRVMIAMALACGPDVLIADEPTTALDVTVQAQILDLLKGLREKFGMAVIFITHDFGIVAQTADRVYVMHDGKIVESGPVAEVFEHPKDEYTRKLLAAVPAL